MSMASSLPPLHVVNSKDKKVLVVETEVAVRAEMGAWQLLDKYT